MFDFSIFRLLDEIGKRIGVSFDCPKCKNSYWIQTKGLDDPPNMSCVCGYEFIKRVN